MILVALVATWTQADIDRLKKAISSGILTVSYAGPPARTITYQSLKEMRELLAEMESSVSVAAGRSTFRRARVERGFRGRTRSSFRRNE